MALTVVEMLMEKYKIPYESIGRLEVGTETIIDKSKSVKTVIMQLFHKHGNDSIEGIDNVNACYGATAALFNAVNWVESRSWDGRYAIVVASDIAIYAPGRIFHEISHLNTITGPARPTGGCGAIAMLIGADAPLVIEPGVRGVHMEHAYDFYKPILDSEYPVVSGHYSIQCYLKALDMCYKRYKQAFFKQKKKNFRLEDADYFLFHAPYAKLVQKAYGRLKYIDFLSDPENAEYNSVRQFKGITEEASYTDRALSDAFVALTKELFASTTQPTLYLTKELGNLYCGALYTCLLSLLSAKSDEELLGKRIALFSYGSGLAASIFSIIVRESPSKITKTVDFKTRLTQRIKVSPEEFTKALKKREGIHGGPFQPTDGTEQLFGGTYYLDKIDDEHRRFYLQKPIK